MFFWIFPQARSHPEASLIIRYSHSSDARLHNLCVVAANAARVLNLEIIISCMGRDIPYATPGAKRLFTSGDFESSKANNIGAAAATTDIFIFQDADIIFKPDYYQGILDAVKRGAESVRVGQTCINLNGKAASTLVTPQAIDNLLRGLGNSDAVRDAPGACIAVTRKAFVRVGGHCELFRCYGWEDCYFRYKISKLTEQAFLGGQMVHLPHEDNFQVGRQAENAQLYYDILYTDGGDCLRLAQRDREHLQDAYQVFA